jgi:hypothetical protein
MSDFFVWSSAMIVALSRFSQDHWSALYRAAIIETNTAALPKLILEAEQAVISRKQKLFGTMGTLKEKQALEEALHALRERRELMSLATPVCVTNNNDSLEPHTR